jgi:hypothetical protein
MTVECAVKLDAFAEKDFLLQQTETNIQRKVVCASGFYEMQLFFNKWLLF